jgi:hypothetical protein
MKTTQIVLIFLCTALFASTVSCKKTTDNFNSIVPPNIPDTAAPLQQVPKSSGQVPVPENYSMNCPSAPKYGDSIIYPSGTFGQKDYLISPLNNPLPGRYLSWPVGLVINDSTGTINVTRSETGLRYYIGFVQNGAKDTCLSSLTIGGASFQDSIYVQNSLVKSNVYPYFNGNNHVIDICGQHGECLWDISNNANHQNIRMDRNTGVIDLDKTLQEGAFGLNPVNGATLNANIYYTLGHNSDDAIESLTVQFMYYDHLSSIPPAIKAKIDSRKMNALGYSVLDAGTVPVVRPPIVIIVRNK